MKGIAEKTLFIFMIFVVSMVAGAYFLQNVVTDKKIEAYRTSTHSVALDVSNLVSLAKAATGDIKIEYEVPDVSQVTIKTENNLVKVTRILKEHKVAQTFIFSTPFDLGNTEQSGTKFTISKIDDKVRILGAT